MSSRVKYLTQEEIDTMSEEDVKKSIKNYRGRLNTLAKMRELTPKHEEEIDRKVKILDVLYKSIGKEPRSPVKHLAGISLTDDEIRDGLGQCEEDENGNYVLCLTRAQYNTYRLIIENYLDRKEYMREKSKESYAKKKAAQALDTPTTPDVPKRTSPRRRTEVTVTA